MSNTLKKVFFTKIELTHKDSLKDYEWADRDQVLALLNDIEVGELFFAVLTYFESSKSFYMDNTPFEEESDFYELFSWEPII